jgi:hypothetical protein
MRPGTDTTVTVLIQEPPGFCFLISWEAPSKLKESPPLLHLGTGHPLQLVEDSQGRLSPAALSPAPT